MGWLFLILAGVLETTWVAVLKASQGIDSQHRPALKILVGLAALGISAMSMALMYAAMERKIPMGMSYAVWTGIGAIGTTLLGIILFAEPFDWTRILFVCIIVFGLAGLKLTSPAETTVPEKPNTNVTDVQQGG